MEPSKPQNVKKNNLSLLTHLIKDHGPVSKKELSNLSGLSVVTINKLIPDLLKESIVFPFSTDVITGGRHAVSYVFNEKKKLLLVIKMVETDRTLYFYYYLCDLNGKVIKEKELSAKDLEWSDFLATIDAWKKIYPEIKEIVLGIPGVETSGVLKLVDYPMLKNRAVQQELMDKFKCHVQVENDVNAAILGYAMNQEKNKIISGIYYPLSFPPGGGVSINQKLLKGQNNFVGEVADFPLVADWSKKNLADVDLKKHIYEVLQIFMSTYDPHEVVIYAAVERISMNLIDVISKQLIAAYPALNTPKIVLSRKFNTDYLTGLISLGMNELND